MRRAQAGRQAALGLGLALLAGCVGTGEGVPDLVPDADQIPKTPEEIQLLVYEPLCVQCHRGGNAPKGLSLEASRALDDLVGVASVELPTMLRVAPGEPDESYLIVKLAASDARRVGARMPRIGPPFVGPAQLRAIRKWITDGARSDWVDTSSVAPVVPRVNAGLLEEEGT